MFKMELAESNRCDCGIVQSAEHIMEDCPILRPPCSLTDISNPGITTIFDGSTFLSFENFWRCIRKKERILLVNFSICKNKELIYNCTFAIFLCLQCDPQTLNLLNCCKMCTKTSYFLNQKGTKFSSFYGLRSQSYVFSPQVKHIQEFYWEVGAIDVESLWKQAERLKRLRTTVSGSFKVATLHDV